jgi:hypothetical protein
VGADQGADQPDHEPNLDAPDRLLDDFVVGGEQVGLAADPALAWRRQGEDDQRLSPLAAAAPR